MRALGPIGNTDTETKVLLCEHSIVITPFSQGQVGWHVHNGAYA